MTRSMINVILADYQRIFRIGMASALAAEDDIRIVGSHNLLTSLCTDWNTCMLRYWSCRPRISLGLMRFAMSAIAGRPQFSC